METFEKQNLPNATLALVMGILSIVGCCCYGLPGLIFGIVAVVVANRDIKLYKENPDLYLNYGNVKAGKIMGIIGIILSVFMIVYVISILAYFGMEILTNPELLQEKLQGVENM
ncbi:MAG: hypothetical protein CSA39_05325 [Flavobacteriales bacterium]|nr:MAG: hypothetical protein CR985_01475 [Flavobacteriales bacterium]PIE48910.1 MAG: hypothetical protein CSA39_05325 [Flavobacteriales bacterium]